MEKKNTQATLSLIIAIMVAMALYFWDARNKEIEQIRGVDRTGEVLFEKDRADVDGFPYIRKVAILSESSNEIVFNVHYTLPDEAEGSYSVFVQPNNNDWESSMNTLETGQNTQKVTVTFKPDPPVKRRAESTELYFYISQFADKKFEDNVFEHTIFFNKTWMR